MEKHFVGPFLVVHHFANPAYRTTTDHFANPLGEIVWTIMELKRLRGAHLKLRPHGKSTEMDTVSPQNENVRFVQSRNIREQPEFPGFAVEEFPRQRKSVL
jgi:hypothetical protein